MLSRDHAGEHEDARADDAADAEHGQVKSSKTAFQTGIGIDVDRLGSEQTHVFSLDDYVDDRCSAQEVCLVRDPRA